MHKIVSVLKVGGEYNVEHVIKLKNMLDNTMKEDFEFYCITDSLGRFQLNEHGIKTLIIEHDWPKWWPKIEMFRHHEELQTGPVLYLDLDTVVVDDLSHFFREKVSMAVLKDQLHYKRRKKAYGSGVILFEPSECHFIYEEFIKKPKHYIEKHSVGGDQHFLEEVVDDAQYLQDLFPSQLFSYKINLCKDRKGNGFKGVPKGARIVYFHGKPRPESVNYLGY